MPDSSPATRGAPLAWRRYSPPRAIVGAWHYLGEQFPIGQAFSTALTPLVSYLLYGQIAGEPELDGRGIAIAVVVVVLFLQYRLVDDVCTYYNEELGGPDVIPARPKPMMVGVLVTVPALFVLEPHAAPLAFALGTLALMVACSFVLSIGERLPLSRFVAQVPFLEIVPVLFFAYVYVAWEASTGETLSALSVAAVLGTLVSAFQVWKWSRHLGDDPVERIYRVPWSTVRGILVGLFAVCAAFNVLLYSEANLSPVYLAYALSLCAVFAVLAAPRGRPDERRPWWAGLAFPAALLAGLYVQLLVLA